MELALQNGVVAQHGAEDAGVGDVHGFALADGVVEEALELGVAGAITQRGLGQWQVITRDQIGSQHRAAAGAGEGGKGSQMGHREGVADGFEEPVGFAEGIEHGKLHLREQTGRGHDVELAAEPRSERMRGGFGVTHEFFGCDLEAVPAVEAREHAGEIDRGVAVDAFAFFGWQARHGVFEGDAVEVDQVDFSTMRDEGFEIEIVAVAGAENADGLVAPLVYRAEQFQGQVLPVSVVERCVRDGAFIGLALLADLTVEAGGHAG